MATLIDFQKSQARVIQNLYKRKLLRKTHVLTFAEFTSKAESDIEDMFEPAFYIDLINDEFQKELANPVNVANLNLANPRILVSLEEYFVAHPLKTGMAFNHYRPARCFVESIAKLSTQISTGTLDRFEAAFRALNTLL